MRMNRREFVKYYRDYISGVDIDNIEFKIFNYDELHKFLKENYYDSEFNKDVYWEPDGFMAPFGLYYLDYITSSEDFDYMLGLVDNAKGCKTIVLCLIYDRNYGPIDEEDNKVGYISMIEVNYFFRNKGIFKKSFEYIKDLFKDNNILVISPESINGNEVSVFKRISSIFDGKISVIDEEEYYDSLRKRHKW